MIRKGELKEQIDHLSRMVSSTDQEIDKVFAEACRARCVANDAHEKIKALDEPKVGDFRVTYEVFSDGHVTWQVEEWARGVIYPWRHNWTADLCPIDPLAGQLPSGEADCVDDALRLAKRAAKNERRARQTATSLGKHEVRL